MREEKFHIYLNDDEYSRLIQSLIRLKNSLTAQGRCTDAVDDILYKVLSAKRRKFKRSRQDLCANLFAGSGRPEVSRQ